MPTIDDDREEFMDSIAEFKSKLFYSKYIDSYGYDKVCDVLDVLANTIDDNLKERKIENNE